MRDQQGARRVLMRAMLRAGRRAHRGPAWRLGAYWALRVLSVVVLVPLAFASGVLRLIVGAGVRGVHRVEEWAYPGLYVRADLDGTTSNGVSRDTL